MDLILFITLLSLGCIKGQFFEDRRCRCVCPNPASVVNTTATRQIFTGNVPPNKCDCETVVYPLLRKELEGKLHIFCPRCECQYQIRNTTLIMPRNRQAWAPLVVKRWFARSYRTGRRLMRNVHQCQAVVLLIITTLAMAILYMFSLNWLRTLIRRNHRRGQPDYFQDGRFARHERPQEVDYVRAYRGEYERNRLARDSNADSEEEGLLNWEDDN